MLCALGAALCFGVATTLQALGARRADEGAGATSLLMSAVRQLPYLLGLAVDAAGFVLEIVALRTLPVYAVGAALAASLAVTAVVAGPLLGTRLRGREWGAVAVVCGGLAVLALASGKEGGGHGGTALRWGVLVAALVVLAMGAGTKLLDRLPATARSAALGLAAGFGFGVVEVAVRLLDPLTVRAVLTNPATYALLVGGGAAFLLLTSALHRGSVTAATAGMVLGETIGPALVGVLALDDRTRSGWAPAAVAGFALAVLGGLALARFGEGGAAGNGAGADPGGGAAGNGGAVSSGSAGTSGSSHRSGSTRSSSRTSR
jgi:drug/metabolite transporter (DMT)-like permease